jgi:hypothetical protein
MKLDYKNSQLYNFLGGNLHNFWPEEYGTWENAINDYLTHEGLPVLEKIQKELKIIKDSGFDEGDLRRIVTKELRANFYAPGDGTTYQVWLEKIAIMVEAWIKKKKEEQS